MGYVGNVGERITVKVKLVNDYEYQTQFGYRTQTNHIYTMVDDQENVLVWKTSGYMGIEIYDESGNYVRGHAISKNDVVSITATVKAHGEYKGTEQTEVQRLKVNALIEEYITITKEDKDKAKREEQMASLNDGDKIWRMSYKRYKEHYSDCEIVAGSFDRDVRRGTSVEVIIRSGRLKASGVRGKHFIRYQLINNKGQKVTYTAVNSENALKRAEKEFPDEGWEIFTIWKY